MKFPFAANDYDQIVSLKFNKEDRTYLGVVKGHHDLSLGVIYIRLRKGRSEKARIYLEPVLTVWLHLSNADAMPLFTLPSSLR